jgi:hypothetical protein
MEYGLSPRIVNTKFNVLYIDMLKKKDMPREEKLKSMELFREKLG